MPSLTPAAVPSAPIDAAPISAALAPARPVTARPVAARPIARFDLLHLLGLGLAFFLLVGRWTPDRMTGGVADDSLVGEPRFVATLACAGLAFGIACMRGDRRTQRLNPLLGSQAWYWLFWGYVSLATIWASDYDLAGEKAYELGLIAVLHLAIIGTVRSRPREHLIEGIMLGMMAVSLLMAVMGVLNPQSIRTGGLLGGGPNVFGRQMLILTMTSAYFLLATRRTRLVQCVLIGLMLQATALVLLSGSRGALLSQIVGLGTLLMFTKVSLRLRLAVLMIGGVMGGGALLFTDVGQSALQTFQTRVMKQTVEDGHMAGREDLYAGAIEIGLDRPVFGNGLNTYRDYFGIYPHNIFLELFAETGGVGVLLFLMLVYASLRPALHERLELETAVFSLWLGLLAAANFSGDLFDSRLLFLFLPLLVRPKASDPLPTVP